MNIIRLQARDLVTMPFDRINEQPVTRKPALITIGDEEWVEWYAGSDDPDKHDYLRMLVRADMPIHLEVDFDNLDLS